MKKVLAIILALLMLLSLASLAACAEKKEETKEPEVKEETKEPEAETSEDGEITEEVLKASKPNEYVKEKLEAGWEVEIAFSANNDNYFVGKQLYGGCKDHLEAEGFVTRYLAAPDENIIEQINQLENLVAEATVAGIIVQTTDSSSVQPAVEAAQEAGICVVIYGIECDYPTIISTVDNYTCGIGTAAMASAWIDARYPDAGEGDIKTAITGSVMMAPLLEMYTGFQDGAAKDPRMNVVFMDDNTMDVEDGFNTAQNALMADPGIRVFISYQMSVSLGINNYLESQGVDMTEFGIFTTSVDDTTAEMLEKAANGTAAIRGTISAGDDVSATTAKAMLGALYGEYKIGDRLVDPLTAIVSTDYECDWSAYAE